MINYKEELNNILNLRLANLEKLHSLEQEAQKTKEYIAKKQLDLKFEFNKRIDTKDPQYSNAEKRKVALENELKTDEEICEACEALEEQEKRLLEEQLQEKRLKLTERYLFKEIDLIKG